MLSKIVNEIKLFFKTVLLIDNTNKIDDLLIQHKWFNEYVKKVFIDYIEQKARELAETENIKIFSVSYDEINKGVEDENEKSVGIFHYYRNKKVVTYESLENFYKLSNKSVPINKVFPRIEMSERGDVFTMLHELGHYFIYKRDQSQSESAANLFIEEFFDNYLPPFFKWIYQIEVKIRGNMELKFTLEECKEYWKQYCEFRDNYEN